MSIAPYYEGWGLFNSELARAIQHLDGEQLALTIRAEWPIWASVSHLAGSRTYWLCTVAGEPGIETTPFADHPDRGWEDDLGRPRRADELVRALESTWRIIDHALHTWTPRTLEGSVRRARANGEVQLHTRQSILWRLITHDAFHAGEISLVLGGHGLAGGGPNGPIDMWSGLSR